MIDEEYLDGLHLDRPTEMELTIEEYRSLPADRWEGCVLIFIDEGEVNADGLNLGEEGTALFPHAEKLSARDSVFVNLRTSAQEVDVSGNAFVEEIEALEARKMNVNDTPALEKIRGKKMEVLHRERSGLQVHGSKPAHEVRTSADAEAFRANQIEFSPTIYLTPERYGPTFDPAG